MGLFKCDNYSIYFGSPFFADFARSLRAQEADFPEVERIARDIERDYKHIDVSGLIGWLRGRFPGADITGLRASIRDIQDFAREEDLYGRDGEDVLLRVLPEVEFRRGVMQSRASASGGASERGSQTSAARRGGAKGQGDDGDGGDGQFFRPGIGDGSVPDLLAIASKLGAIGDPDPDDQIIPDPHKPSGRHAGSHLPNRMHITFRCLRKAIPTLRDPLASPRQKLTADKYILLSIPGLVSAVRSHLRKKTIWDADSLIDGVVQRLLHKLYESHDFARQPNPNLQQVLALNVRDFSDLLTFSAFSQETLSQADAGLLIEDVSGGDDDGEREDPLSVAHFRSVYGADGRWDDDDDAAPSAVAAEDETPDLDGCLHKLAEAGLDRRDVARLAAPMMAHLAKRMDDTVQHVKEKLASRAENRRGRFPAGIQAIARQLLSPEEGATA